MNNRFEFVKGNKYKQAKTVVAEILVPKKSTTLSSKENKSEFRFYVYGHGRLAGIFENAGDAIRLAEKISGVVVSSEQAYIWEAGNKVSWYRNFNLTGFTVNQGESTLEACRKKVATYERQPVEEIYLSGCTSKDMSYLLDKGVAVIGMRDGNNAILLVGYDAKTVTYINPSDGGTYTSAFDKVDEMLKGSGNTFIGYVR